MTVSLFPANNVGGEPYGSSAGRACQVHRVHSDAQRDNTADQVVVSKGIPLVPVETSGLFTCDIPIPTCVYQVTLKFADISLNTAAKRAFDVKARGRDCPERCVDPGCPFRGSRPAAWSGSFSGMAARVLFTEGLFSTQGVRWT